MFKLFCSKCGYATGAKAKACLKGGKCDPRIKRKVRAEITRVLVRPNG